MDSDSDQEILIDTSDDEFSSSDSETEMEHPAQVDLDYSREWCTVDLTLNADPHPPFAFTGDPGIKVPITDIEDPLEYFGLFFDSNILSKVVVETNRYADIYFETAVLTPSSRYLKWESTDEKEIQRFIALLLLQGLVDKPVERWYWSKRPILSTPFYGKVMSSARYSLLMKFLHFENSGESDAANHPHYKLRKIYDVHNLLVKNFKSVYTPEKNISIDESLIGYKGNLGWKQYIPTKRARFGMKLYQLCESQSGYIWNSMFYTGQGTVFQEEYEQYGVSTKTVLSLSHDLMDKGYTIITDNFYTSPELAEILISKKTDIYGTMRANRKNLPLQIKLQKLKKGELIAFQKGKICVMKWQDKKPLCLLSTIHNAAMKDVQTRQEVKKKPSLVLDYNLSMGGVDVADQCLSYYKVTRNQQRKYYKKIFRYLLNQAVWNAFVIYNVTVLCLSVFLLCLIMYKTCQFFRF